MKVIIYQTLFYSLFLPSTLLAQGGFDNRTPQGGGTGGGPKLDNPLQVSSITDLFVKLLDVLTIFAIPIVVFFIIYAGFLYVTARGNVDQVTKAHRALLYALIGGLLILGGSVLIEVVKGTVDAVKNG